MYSRKIISAVTAALVLSVPVSATHTCDYSVDVKAEVGIYNSPIVLGDDFNVDACGSSVHHYKYYQNNDTNKPLFGLCDIGDSAMENFTISWKAKLVGAFSNPVINLGTFSGANAKSGLQTTFSSSLFSAAGTYLIGLYFQIDNQNEWMLLPDSNYGRGAGDGYGDQGLLWNSTSSQNGLKNAGFDSTALTITPASVPEPAAALLLISGLAFIAYRRKNRKNPIKSK